VWARVGGWLEALDLPFEMEPALDRCLPAQGRDCAYTLTLKPKDEWVAATAAVGES
jgi:hypothetical protein